MNIQIIIGNRHWSFGTNRNKKVNTVEEVKPVQSVGTTPTYCLKCGCVLFPDETMCPDCLLPVRDNKGWTA